MKILLICNDSYSVLNFRKELISFLNKKNNSVYLISGDSIKNDEIKKLNVSYSTIKFEKRSLNIFKAIKLKTKLSRKIKEISPDLVFTFMIKPNTIGVLAAKKAGIKNVFSMVEGLGDPFQPVGIKGKIIRLIVCNMYKKAFSFVKKAFFLNSADKLEFITRKLISSDKAIVIPGIGIDTNLYLPDLSISKSKTIICLARLIKSKGIIDYCEIADKVHNIRPDIKFELYGEENQISKKDILKYIENGSVYYGGYSSNSKQLIANSSIVVSTSFYREGFPRVILEAMALGKPVIASDTVGNVDAVLDGVTGYIVKKHDIDAFANKIIELVDNEEKMLELGKNARKICEEKYDSLIINKIIYQTLTE